MKVDVLVVGSGISGVGAAIAAGRAGATVALARRGYGATVMTSGIVRFDQAGLGAGVGVEDAAEVAGLLTDLIPLERLPERAEFLTALGRIVEADFAFPTMVHGSLGGLRGRSLAVVGFDGLVEVRPEPVARAARSLGIDAAAVKIPFPEVKHTHDLTTPELARLCDDLGPAKKLVAALQKATADFDFVALPPLLGLLNWEAVSSLFDEALGDHWFELVAALPSVPGMRIQQALDDQLAAVGTVVIHGPVRAVAQQGDIILGLEAGDGAGQRKITTKQVVLATGGIVGRGLRVAGDEIREALFGLPVDHDPLVEGDDTPAALRAGLKLDAEFRPLDPQGAPVYSNVRAAGELTGSTFANGRGGLAIALGAGWAAGEFSAAAAAAGAAEGVGFAAAETWREIDVESDPHACVNCGLCLSRCPTIRALTREKLSYPGPRSMRTSIVRFETELDEVVEELSLCTLCGACSVVCPACVPVPENITKARQILGRIAPQSAPQAYQAIRGALETPKKLFDAEPIDGPRKDQAECVLFIGCSLPYYDRENAEGTIKLLEALGVDFTLIDEVCCGGPLEVIGAEGADLMAVHNVREMKRVGARRIISCCPRCTETMETTAAYADEFEIEHTTVLLARLLPGTEVARSIREKVGGQKVTFHDPCERARLAGEVEAARSVMSTVGLELVEMARSGIFTECCGAGGGVRAAQTKASIRMARLRVADAVATGAPQLLTECPSCLHNLYNGRKRKQNIEISNLSSFLGSQLD